MSDAARRQQLLGSVIAVFVRVLRDGEQKMFGGNVFVLEIVSFLEGLVEDFGDLIREAGLGAGAARNFGQAIDLAQCVLGHGLGARAEFGENRRDYAFFVG